jgi:hypothetical protein
MAYLGYKNKAFMNYKREQEKIKIWKIKQNAEQAKKRKKFREWRNITTISILQLVVVALIIVFYGVFASFIMTDAKADTIKVGDGPFVLAVSYTDSYKDLQYVANFSDCDTAMVYFHDKCNKAPIAMCQAEDRMYMPVNHNSVNTFSSFDFEVDDSQSCGFVKTQEGYSTFVEEKK